MSLLVQQQKHAPKLVNVFLHSLSFQQVYIENIVKDSSSKFQEGSYDDECSRKRVAVLHQGTGFGELALTLPNSKRQATVIASEKSDFVYKPDEGEEPLTPGGAELIVISRAVYDRSMGLGSGSGGDSGRSSLSDRVAFLQHAPLFRSWPDERCDTHRRRPFRHALAWYFCEDVRG
jgi:hypothetical protein